MACANRESAVGGEELGGDSGNGEGAVDDEVGVELVEMLDGVALA